MADAPAAGGGNGWGAVEVIIALILAIGLITTLTGGTIKPIFSDGTATTKKSTGSSTATSGCGVIINHPVSKQKISNSVDVSGTFPECLDNSDVPDAVSVQVVDSTGALLSAYTSINVSHGFFGPASFSSTVALSGIAQSTTGYVIITAPQSSGVAITKRIAIQLIPGTGTYSSTTTTTNSTGSYFVPNPNAPTNTQQTTTYTNVNTNTNTNTNNNTNTNTGGGGATF